MGFLDSLSRIVYLPSGKEMIAGIVALGLTSFLALPLSGQEGAGGLAPMAPMELTPKMRQWAADIAGGVDAPEEQMRRLWHALMDPHRVGLREVTLPTPTAVEAFREKRTNCVGFATLLVALAREVGVPAFFVTVHLPSEGEARGDLRLQQEHLAAAVGPPHALRVFDFAGEEAGRQLSWRAVSDLTALALFHSNRGVEALLHGESRAAAASLEQAVRFDPALPVAWVNLGVALRRQGDDSGAEAAYRRALELDPETPAAYRNLAALLAHQGQPTEAARLLTEAHRAAVAEADPLRYLSHARRLLESGDLEAARSLYAKALELAQATTR
jgi:tetratricopeptide (TPR) repeat protein